MTCLEWACSGVENGVGLSVVCIGRKPKIRARIQQSPEPPPRSYDWLDADSLVAAVVPSEAPPPEEPAAALGPKIEDNSHGEKRQTRTYPDLLNSRHDEAMFDFMGTSQLVRVSVATGHVTPLGEPRHYTSVKGSPDGRFILVSYLLRPYSYSVPCGRFPKRVEVWSR